MKDGHARARILALEQRVKHLEVFTGLDEKLRKLQKRKVVETGEKAGGRMKKICSKCGAKMRYLPVANPEVSVRTLPNKIWICPVCKNFEEGR